MTFTCDTCNKAFTARGDLKRHIKCVHYKIKDFKCDKCDYMCSIKSRLKTHIKRVHDKIKDIKCDKCDYMCSTKDHLKTHIKCVHDKIKDFKCDKCDYTCSTKVHLKCHIKQVHDKIKDFKCDKCDIMYCNNSHLKRHIKSIHDNIKDFKCDKCEYACSTNCELKSHIKNIHKRPVMDKRMSLGEYAIYTYLTKNNIIFEKEKTFNNLISPKSRKLRYDFYIQSHNLLIEFDGAQHFKKVKWTALSTQEYVDEHYNYIVECDHLKNEYADTNKIKLYRIKYTDVNNIDNILKVLLI